MLNLVLCLLLPLPAAYGLSSLAWRMREGTSYAGITGTPLLCPRVRFSSTSRRTTHDARSTTFTLNSRVQVRFALINISSTCYVRHIRACIQHRLYIHSTSFVHAFNLVRTHIQPRLFMHPTSFGHACCNTHTPSFVSFSYILARLLLFSFLVSWTMLAWDR
ncbi:hypothetical protein DFH29DRAFT_273948 [Suillus ampliporus]|nr:hypothetical protein DFH29DRAFT_273948 [Suillus ampliporus]